MIIHEDWRDILHALLLWSSTVLLDAHPHGTWDCVVPTIFVAARHSRDYELISRFLVSAAALCPPQNISPQSYRHQWKKATTLS
mmetsp:Transcript_5887/g.24621  ORF Transcript_5887/g.24621 Transcript_5887/m.24621 type:complete len:84 (-) Transcript_5887:435-686(-)